MRQRSHVFNRLDDKPCLLEARDGVFATAAGAFDADFDVFHAEFDGFFRNLLGRHHTGKRRAFPAAFESAGAGRRPAQNVALHIGDRDDRVVEGRLDVRNPR